MGEQGGWNKLVKGVGVDHQPGKGLLENCGGVTEGNRKKDRWVDGKEQGKDAWLTSTDRRSASRRSISSHLAFEAASWFSSSFFSPWRSRICVSMSAFPCSAYEMASNTVHVRQCVSACAHPKIPRENGTAEWHPGQWKTTTQQHNGPGGPCASRMRRCSRTVSGTLQWSCGSRPESGGEATLALRS